jgi:hypothetical protein
MITIMITGHSTSGRSMITGRSTSQAAEHHGSPHKRVGPAGDPR